MDNDDERITLRRRIVDSYAALYGAAPDVLVRAPGRVNLIGEHTDYNDGFVLPMAIDRAVWIALRPRDDRTVALRSLDFEASVSFRLDALENASNDWIEYVKGTAWALQQEGHELRGWEGVVAGDVPLGAGLSSSAALELAALRAFAAVSGLDWHPERMARLGQKAENEWVGVRCGIMDQMISAAGKEGHALLIDCRTLEAQDVPLPEDVVVVILDTATRRGLVDSAYNERRRQCEAAAGTFGVVALRDVDSATFERRAAELEPSTRKRARHVITENERTLLAAEAMQAGDARRLGRLMIDSHRSLRDDFEVSSEALNVMVDLSVQQRGCIGARMTGAGFGGCAVAIVERDRAGEFAASVSRDYRAATRLEPRLYVSRATHGASIVPLSELQ